MKSHDKTNVLDNLLSYEDNIVSYLVVDDEIWLKGTDVAKILGYVDLDQSLRKHVDEDDKENFSSLSRRIDGIQLGDHHKSIYINESGLYSLIIRSNKPEAKKFKRWITKEVLPSIRKFGTYSLNTSFKSFKPSYEISDLKKLDKQNVLYIGYVGIHNNEQIFKFGKTGDIIRRIGEHQKSYETFNIQHVVLCDNKDEVENLFNKHLKIKKTHRSLIFNSSNDVELFAINDIFTLDEAKRVMDELVKTFKLPIVSKYEQVITLLKNDVLHLRKENESLKDMLKSKDETFDRLLSDSDEIVDTKEKQEDNKVTSNVKKVGLIKKQRRGRLNVIDLKHLI